MNEKITPSLEDKIIGIEYALKSLTVALIQEDKVSCTLKSFSEWCPCQTQQARGRGNSSLYLPLPS